MICRRIFVLVQQLEGENKMLKAVFLATSMLIAAPVFAQDMPKPAESQPAQQAPTTTPEAAPVTDDAAPDAATDQTAAAAPQTTEPAAQPAEMAAQPTPAPAPAETAAAQPAPAAQPASTQDQVANAVGRDFGTYDTDADGALSATEFASWMGTLRKAAEPSFAPDSAEAKTWATQAFTSADADKSATINKQELTVFLTPKPS
jgi:outer membrane biosynthesis protein TonB